MTALTFAGDSDQSTERKPGDMSAGLRRAALIGMWRRHVSITANAPARSTLTGAGGCSANLM